MSERTEQEAVRRQSLATLREHGVDPYPAAGWDVTDHAADILAAYDDERHDPEQEGTEPMRVSLAGRLRSIRGKGKVMFVDLMDSTGKIQLYLKRDNLQEPGEPEGYYNTVVKKLLDIGDIVGVRGTVFRTKMGEVSVEADELVPLAKGLRPIPFPKEVDGETFNEITDKEFRYRQRYVDLVVNPEVREVFRQRARLIAEIRRFLDARGYVEVETPALQPLYGGAAARPFTTHHNALDMPLFLRIADELYLKRLIVGGFDGVYEIAKDFRNEGLSRFHNPEFTMLELYVAYKDYAWMMDLVEEMIAGVAESLHGDARGAGGGARRSRSPARSSASRSSKPSRSGRGTTSIRRTATRSLPPRSRSVSKWTRRWVRASSSTRFSASTSSRTSSSRRSSPTTPSSSRPSRSATARKRG